MKQQKSWPVSVTGTWKPMVEENELILVSVSVVLGKINSKPIPSQVQTKMVAVESKIKTHLYECFLFGKSNHKAKDCWSKGNNSRVHKAQALQQTESKADSKTLQGQEASACMVKLIKASSDKQIELAGGEKIPVVSAACQDTGEGKREHLVLTERMPVKEGKVNGQSVSVLRDSGCSGTVIRRSLVRDEQLTGLQQLCVLIDGTVRRVDEAEVEVQTPFFSGKVKAMCMQKPIYDLIVGNIPGVRGT